MKKSKHRFLTTREAERYCGAPPGGLNPPDKSDKSRKAKRGTWPPSWSSCGIRFYLRADLDKWLRDCGKHLT